MNRKTRMKLKQRIYSYLFDMKQGEEEKVAKRITEDFELLTLEMSDELTSQRETITKLKKSK